MPLTPLLAAVQNYAWGIVGGRSLAAQLWRDSNKQAGKEIDIDEARPYSEFWVGAHPNGMNHVAATGERANEFISRQYPVIKDGKESEQPPLPFLMKVLSIDSPLSIQCHPDKKLASTLHAKFPQIYVDGNHKPEINLALHDGVESLCGFRPWVQIAEAFQKVEEFRHLLGEEFYKTHSKVLTDPEKANESEITEALKIAFHILMTADKETVSASQRLIAAQAEQLLSANKCSDSLQDQLQVFQRIYALYPGDVGCFSALLLNHFISKSLQCLFIRPNVLHAYMKGQIVECMSSSDNCIRGGLTAKFRDIDLLAKVLDYTCGFDPYIDPVQLPIKFRIDQHSSTETETKSIINRRSPSAFLYDPRVGDYVVYFIHVPNAAIVEGFKVTGSEKCQSDSTKVQGPGVLLLLQGKAKITLTDSKEDPVHLIRGTSLLMPPNASLTIQNCAPASSSVIEDLPSNSCSESSETPNFPPISIKDILRNKEDGDCLIVITTGHYMLD